VIFHLLLRGHTHSISSLFLLATLLAGLVILLGLVVQGTPHFSQLLADSAKGQVRIFLLELGAMFLGKEHESRQGLLAATGLLLAGLDVSVSTSCARSVVTVAYPSEERDRFVESGTAIVS
jgi:urea transporter